MEKVYRTIGNNPDLQLSQICSWCWNVLELEYELRQHRETMRNVGQFVPIAQNCGTQIDLSAVVFMYLFVYLHYLPIHPCIEASI